MARRHLSKPLVFAVLAAAAATATAFAVRRTIVQGRKAPVARKIAHEVLFGKVSGQNRGKNPMAVPKKLIDNYFWLRDDKREKKEVLDHVKAENAYTKRTTAHLQPLVGTLYNEFLSHLKETDDSVPYPHGPYVYFSRTVKGKSYSIACRKVKGAPEGEEHVQILLDENQVAEGKDYCDVGALEPSPDHNLLAYAVDFTGAEDYEVHVKDLSTGRELDVINKTGGDIVWGADNSVIYYDTLDEENRPHKIWRHVLGTDQSTDVCLYEEVDQAFTVGIGKTDSHRYLAMQIGSRTTSEIWLIDLQGVRGPEGHENAELKVVQARQEDHRYQVEHHGERLWIITNKDGCKDGKLVSCPLDRTGVEAWEEVEGLPYDASKSLKYMCCFKEHMVIAGREGGFKQLWVRDMNTGDMHTITHPEPIYNCYPTSNYEFDSSTFRFGYNSLLSPQSTFDYDLNTRTRILLKEKEVPNYNRELYGCQRSYASAADGTQVPISMVYRRDLYPDGIAGTEAPTMLYAYGSYGHCSEPDFSYVRLSFLDRGVVYCIAHIRGGGEMGRRWYEDEGKFLTKMNTFTDFIACAEHLIKTEVTTNERLAICGRSAGGLLMGAVVNMRPDLFRIVVADVPFLDLMNTMCDPSIPLTAEEWLEWGNPNEEKFYEYMKQYCPYYNIKAQAYPAILLSAGLNDPRVAYWEPAKWVQKVRELRTNDELLVLKVDMSAGHFSASDRYKNLREYAFEYAVVLDQLGAQQLIAPVKRAAL